MNGFRQSQTRSYAVYINTPGEYGGQLSQTKEIITQGLPLCQFNSQNQVIRTQGHSIRQIIVINNTVNDTEYSGIIISQETHTHTLTVTHHYTGDK